MIDFRKSVPVKDSLLISSFQKYPAEAKTQFIVSHKSRCFKASDEEIQRRKQDQIEEEEASGNHPDSR